MNAWLTRLLTAGLVLGVLAAPAAAAPTVKDEGNLFSPTAKEQANRLIAEIAREFHKDVFIEAYNKPPANKAAEWDKNKSKSAFVSQFFEQWARERFQALGTNGIYILFFRQDPGFRVQVEVGRETLRKEFREEDLRELDRLLVAKFREKQYDAALTEGLEFVKTAMVANEKKVKQPDVARPSGTGPTLPVPHDRDQHRGGGIMDGLGGSICWIIAVVAVVWIVVGLIRSFTRASRPMGGPMYGGGGGPGYGPGYGAGYGPGYGGGGGGGGFMSGLLGGMFGAAAGNWMYDRWFRGESGPHGGGFTPGAQAGQPDYGPSGDDMGRVGGGMGGGDDFGGDTGGSAGGGGDFGGGGGDFGGGGGDFGGGGDY